MFITNNHASFHLWLKESLVKHQKVSKYYENDYLQNFLLLFISLLTAPIVKAGLSPSKKNLVVCFIESPLKIIKNTFYFILKPLFVLKIFKFLSLLFKVNFKIHDVTTWLVKNCNTYITQYLTK